MIKLLMGNEAIALGAIRAGVQVVTGYPGTPSTEVLETIAKHNDGSIYVEWSVNEKVALEVAAGASYAGARAMVTMKQVGMNVASDPLMNLNYVGVGGGVVVLIADDPGPISSQTEQDTRHYSKFAKIALFDPSTPEEAYTMVADAFEYSEKIGRPVILRPTTRVCHSCASVEILPDLPKTKPQGFVKDSKWVIFPRLAYANKLKIEESIKNLHLDFSKYSNNHFSGGGKKGIASGGVTYAHVKEIAADCKLLKISTMPFPDKLVLEFLKDLDEVLVIEELDPVIEDELIRLRGLHGLSVKILGKHTGHVKLAGEITPEDVQSAISTFGTSTAPPASAPTPAPAHAPELPIRPPVLCAGCPHRASFLAVKNATKGKNAVYTGDIGCYTLGNAMPLDMVDTCLCMGAGITVAQGLKRVDKDTVHFAFIGDSTFFHSGITGVVNAVYNQTEIVIVILDNSTTAMTGNQPHPGMGITMMNTNPDKISIEAIVKAIGVSKFIRVDPLDFEAAKNAVREVLSETGVRVILFDSPCIALIKKDTSRSVTINEDKCTGCCFCVSKLGCPAISASGKRVKIDKALCNACGLCKYICPANAINVSGGSDNK